MEHILVTGGGGYIGSVLATKLVDRGYRVRVLDRFYWGIAPLSHLADRVEFVVGDVRSIGPEVLRGIDGVVHLAGLSNDPTAEYNPEANWQMNAVATERLADLCLRQGIRRVTYGSSCSIYDGLEGDEPFDETAPVKPRGAYSTSKFYGEEVLLDRVGLGLEPVVFRQGTVFGPSTRMRFDLVVNTFVKDALTSGKLFLHGGGWMWRPLVDVSDVAEAHIRCLEASTDAVAGEIFNVVLGNYQVRQLAMLVAGSLKLRGIDVQLESVPAPPLVRNYRCTNYKLREHIGFEPRVSILESIESILELIESGKLRNLLHPRFYNIDWMTLLEEVAGVFRGIDLWQELPSSDVTVDTQPLLAAAGGDS